MLDWKSIIINPEDSINNAIQLLNKGIRILLVAKTDNILMGTVTDGDIRRGLIRKLPMESSVKQVMNKNPITSLSPYSRKEVLTQMSEKDLLHMPIVGNDGALCGLETLQHLIEKKSYDNPIFLMAGGFGSRLHPLTDKTPKPLLHVGNKPLLETILMQFIDAGFHNFFISIYYKSEMIKEYFGDGSSWGVSIQYVQEEKPLGTAGALALLPDDLPDLPLIMMNGDILTKIDLEYLLHFHNNNSAIATMCVRKYDFQVPYGVVEINESHVTDMKEKPLHSYFINAGIYVIDRSLIKNNNQNSKIDMPDFLYKHIDKKQIKAFPIHEYWLDIGHMKEYERANYDAQNFS
jgi:dTDP-glucose pyrophosphorylase